MKARELLGWLFVALLLVELVALHRTYKEVDADLTMMREYHAIAWKATKVAEIRLRDCEGKYQDREAQSTACWETLAEVLP